MKINGEEKFAIATNYFAIGVSDDNYTLQFSVDGEEWTDADDETPAGENHIVSNCPKNLLWRLKDNTSDVLIQW